MWIFFVNYYITIPMLFRGFYLLFDVLDKIKGCSVTATMPQQSYNSNQKGTAAKMTSQHSIVFLTKKKLEINND